MNVTEKIDSSRKARLALHYFLFIVWLRDSFPPTSFNSRGVLDLFYRNKTENEFVSQK